MRRAFTIVELLISIAVIAMLGIVSLRHYTADRDRSRTEALRATLDVIQTAIERYHTDRAQYPLFLLGGDVAGWQLWHATYDEPMPDPMRPQNAWLNDPLIAGGYLTSYPANPFVDDHGASVCIQTSRTGAVMGDPRFGRYGHLSGNGVDDPKLFRNWLEDDPQYGPRVETRRTQLALGLLLDDIPPYAMGGRRGPVDPSSPTGFQTISTWWPGMFLYRGVQSVAICRKCWITNWPNQWTIGSRTDAYLLGVFGEYRTTGKDVIRLDQNDPTGQPLYYEIAPPWGQYSNSLKLGWRTEPAIQSQMGLPEVHGGGSAWRGPVFPYNFSMYGARQLIYGAPDGVPDGIVQIRTGDDSQLSGMPI